MSKKIELRALVDGETAMAIFGKTSDADLSNENVEWVSLEKSLCGKDVTVGDQVNRLHNFMADKGYSKDSYKINVQEIRG